MTRPLRTVLAATDGSPSGRLAVVRAASIARTTGAVLHAIHVIDPAEQPTGIAASGRGSGAGTSLRRHLAGIRPQPELHLANGPAYVEITRLGRALDADLIVIGAHGGPVPRRFFVGTTAGRIARHGDRSLLLVRRPVHGPYRRVLVGVDNSPASADAVATASLVAPTATIIPAMVHQVTGERKLRSVTSDAAIEELRAGVTEDGRQELVNFLAEHAGRIETTQPVFEVGIPTERLPELPGEHRCDLIAVGTRGSGGIRYALIGSVAEHVLRDTDRDVLLARHGPTRFRPT